MKIDLLLNIILIKSNNSNNIDYEPILMLPVGKNINKKYQDKNFRNLKIHL